MSWLEFEHFKDRDVAFFTKVKAVSILQLQAQVLLVPEPP